MDKILFVLGIITALITLKQESEKLSIKQADANAKPKGPSLNDLYKKHGRQKGVDWRLLKAIARVESSENPQAFNPNDPSIGLMQVLCRADESGKCTNKLNVQGWPPEDGTELFDPDYNLHIAAQILAWNIDQFGMPKGIAVYNAWKARHAPDEGPFPNQGYVDKVMREYEQTKQSHPQQVSI
jgi:soluble lytic murein transglycosylase-like protein